MTTTRKPTAKQIETVRVAIQDAIDHKRNDVYIENAHMANVLSEKYQIVRIRTRYGYTTRRLALENFLNSSRPCHMIPSVYQWCVDNGLKDVADEFERMVDDMMLGWQRRESERQREKVLEKIAALQAQMNELTQELATIDAALAETKALTEGGTAA